MSEKLKKPVTVRSKLRPRKKGVSPFIRTRLKSAASDVWAVGTRRRLKTAGVEIPHPFLAELVALPAGFGALGAGLGSFVDEDDAAKRYALTAGLMGLGVALGRGAGAKLPRAWRNLRHSLSGAGIGGGMLASDALLPEMGHEPVFAQGE